MALVEGGKRGFSVLALTIGVCLTGPSWADDWRTLRPIDLPAVLVRATWSDGAYLSEGHPIQFGRMVIKMQPNDVVRQISVKVAGNGADGLVIDNLTCYNALSGERTCAVLLNGPKYCHLFVSAKPKVPDTEHFDLECPADLKLGN
jgi:hypothetical protein